MIRSEAEAEAAYRALLVRHRPPDAFGEPELFVGRSEISDATLYLVGVASNGTGESLTGSAASSSAYPIERAFMEWIERLGTVEFGRCPTSEYLLDRDGHRVGGTWLDVEPPGAFPWAWSRSNGVAIARTFREAADRAEAELFERDAVLRSWYGDHAPVPIDGWEDLVPAPLRRHYVFRAAAFDSQGRTQSPSVAGLFGFPRPSAETGEARAALFACGFGTGRSSGDALEKAVAECMQGIGFLWGEAAPEAFPSPAPTPSFHQAHYHCEQHHHQIQQWLDGEHGLYRGALECPVERGAPAFLDLSPPWLEGLRIVRAIPRGQVPLAFGRGHPWAPCVPEALAVHPIC